MNYLVKVKSEYMAYEDRTIYEASLIRKKDNKPVCYYRTYNVDENCILEDREENRIFLFKISTLELKEEINPWKTFYSETVRDTNYGTITMSNTYDGTLVREET